MIPITEKERHRRDWRPDLANVLSEIKSFTCIYRDPEKKGWKQPRWWLGFEVQVDEDLESMAQVKCNIELFRASARDLTIVCYWGYTKLRTHLELYLNHLLTRLAWVSLLDFLSLHFITCKSNNSQLHEVLLRILYDNMLTSMVLWIISNSSPLSVPTSSPLWVGKSSHLCISRLYFPVSLILGLPMWLFFFFFWPMGCGWKFPAYATRGIPYESFQPLSREEYAPHILLLVWISEWTYMELIWAKPA